MRIAYIVLTTLTLAGTTLQRLAAAEHDLIALESQLGTLVCTAAMTNRKALSAGIAHMEELNDLRYSPNDTLKRHLAYIPRAMDSSFPPIDLLDGVKAQSLSALWEPLFAQHTHRPARSGDQRLFSEAEHRLSDELFSAWCGFPRNCPAPSDVQEARKKWDMFIGLFSPYLTLYKYINDLKGIGEGLQKVYRTAESSITEPSSVLAIAKNILHVRSYASALDNDDGNINIKLINEALQSYKKQLLDDLIIRLKQLLTEKAHHNSPAQYFNVALALVATDKDSQASRDAAWNTQYMRGEELQEIVAVMKSIAEVSHAITQLRASLLEGPTNEQLTTMLAYVKVVTDHADAPRDTDGVQKNIALYTGQLELSIQLQQEAALLTQTKTWDEWIKALRGVVSRHSLQPKTEWDWEKEYPLSKYFVLLKSLFPEQLGFRANEQNEVINHCKDLLKKSVEFNSGEKDLLYILDRLFTDTLLILHDMQVTKAFSWDFEKNHWKSPELDWIICIAAGEMKCSYKQYNSPSVTDQRLQSWFGSPDEFKKDSFQALRHIQDFDKLQEMLELQFYTHLSQLDPFKTLSEKTKARLLIDIPDSYGQETQRLSTKLHHIAEYISVSQNAVHSLKQSKLDESLLDENLQKKLRGAGLRGVIDNLSDLKTFSKVGVYISWLYRAAYSWTAIGSGWLGKQFTPTTFYPQLAWEKISYPDKATGSSFDFLKKSCGLNDKQILSSFGCPQFMLDAYKATLRKLEEKKPAAKPVPPQKKTSPPQKKTSQPQEKPTIAPSEPPKS